MIEAIKESKLLTPEAFTALEALSEELELTYNSVQVHRTRTEMEVSVLNELKFPTPASKYWQSVREQNAMFQGVAGLSFDYRELKVRIKLLQREILEEADDLEREILEIDLERKKFTLKDMRRAAKARIREIRDWSDIKTREAKKMSKEDLADVDNHQLIGYTRRWVNQTIQMGQNGSQSERQNLIGQLQSGLALCEKKGLLLTVLAIYPSDLRKQILLEHRGA